MEFVNILKKHSYYADKLELNKINKDLSHDELMKYLIKKLGRIDKHFYIYSADDFKKQEDAIIKYEKPTAIFKNNSLTLIVPSFVGFLLRKHGISYALILHKALHKAYKNNITNIQIDLRHNMGGSEFPMLLGLSSLLPDKVKLLYTLNNKQMVTASMYIDNNAVIKQKIKTREWYPCKKDMLHFKYDLPHVKITILIRSNSICSRNRSSRIYQLSQCYI